ncbi:hypothetical protein E1B28_003499 [Marasmius oreades]|uniref:Sulfotransferase n=1 Tax=Marasmius oreades TaxID=181124 RepID=A0A9P7RMQ4_9AGAR|nr:uncharacterized protein E1B28_003499 [Marasmius oreades]KAG7085975.1 hypothetical protein E1B28_003499 [Marasmius oreades]
MTTEPRRVFVFTHARTASNVFYKVLASHPIFHPAESSTFISAFGLGTDSQSARSRDKWQRWYNMSDDEVSKISYQSKLDDLERMMAEADMNKGKWFLATEHPYILMSSAEVHSHMNVPGSEIFPIPVIEDRMLDVIAESPSSELTIPGHVRNPTLLPDRIFFSLTPIFTIRHPARVIPSYARAVLNSFGTDTSDLDIPIGGAGFCLDRLVFDAFKAFDEARAAAEGRPPRVPIVVDGDRFVRDPRGQMRRVCEALGIDADEALLKYSWEANLDTEESKKREGFLSVLHRSTGVLDPRYDKPLDLQEEVRDWANKWDEKTARNLEEMVAGAMDDYEYLLQFSI